MNRNRVLTVPSFLVDAKPDRCHLARWSGEAAGSSRAGEFCELLFNAWLLGHSRLSPRILTENRPAFQAAYVLALSQEIANEGADVNVRIAAGLALKNTLSAREQAKKDAQAQRWTMLDPNAKAQMKGALLMALASPQIRAGSVSAQVLASVAALEIPRGEWTDLITTLLNNVTMDQPNVKLTSLQTIGYICESIVGFLVLMSGWWNQWV
jgi:hypothetical protein